MTSFLKWAIPEKKKKERDGSGYLISRSIEEIEIGISRGDQEKILWNL